MRLSSGRSMAQLIALFPSALTSTSASGLEPAETSSGKITGNTRTPRQSARFGVMAISITGSSSPAHGQKLHRSGITIKFDNPVMFIGKQHLLRNTSSRLKSRHGFRLCQRQINPRNIGTNGRKNTNRPPRALGAPQTTSMISLPVST